MLCDHRAATCLLMVLMMFVCGRVSPAQEPPVEPDPEVKKVDARIIRFLEGVSGEDAGTAYQDLLAGSQLLQQEALKGLIEKTTELKKYGRCHGFERIAVRPIGEDLVLLKYLYKCEDFPVVWYFSFYRTPDGGTPPQKGPWRVVTVRFDTRFELLWY